MGNFTQFAPEQQIAGLSSTGLAATGSILTATDTTLLGLSGATLGISAVIAGVVAVVLSLFKGANPLQVPAAKIEQAFEAAADNLFALVVKASMITPAQAVAAMHLLINAADNQEIQANLGVAAQKAITNLTTVINNEIAAVPGVHATTRTINVVQAHSFYVQPNTAGWYPDSITAAAKMTDQLLAAFQSSGPVPASAPVAVTTPRLPGVMPSTVALLPSTVAPAIGLNAPPSQNEIPSSQDLPGSAPISPAASSSSPSDAFSRSTPAANMKEAVLPVVSSGSPFSLGLILLLVVVVLAVKGF